MSVFRSLGGAHKVPPARGGPIAGVEERRIARSLLVATGTLACNRCDAPVALTGGLVTPTDTLTCPYCSHRASARDFLSLAPPTRPARVEVRATYNAR
jgi:DNA-directed RNA polymerase subunit RPC12/RpoP